MNDVGGVFDACPPQICVKVVVAREETPEFDAVHDFDAVALPVPVNFLAENTGNFGIIDVIGVPQTCLAHGGVEAQFEHVTILICGIAARRVPDVCVPEEYGACFAYRLHLTDNVLIAHDVGFVYATKVTARHKEGAATFDRGVGGEEAGLNVKVMFTNIVFGILV